ncbi:MAG: hypothetical protein JRC68_01545, partial [Deltaproteobacteria bacterium]|nr:hypothetical protein [Deltaproteobacteria bacterium]
DIGYQSIEGGTGTRFNNAGMAEPPWEYSGVDQKESGRTEIEASEEYLVRERPQIIGQLKDTYILFQTRDALLMLDQHAAHERIVYETLKKSYQSSKIESQAFLIPHRLELSLKEGRVILQKLDQLSGLGFDFERFGGNTFLLRSVPSILVNVQWEEFLLDLIPIMEEESDLTNDKAMDRLLTIMSCHSAIRAGQRMSPGEMALLLEQLEEMDLPTNCPHGRPIFKRFTYNEIEKMFKRVV